MQSGSSETFLVSLLTLLSLYSARIMECTEHYVQHNNLMKADKTTRLEIISRAVKVQTLCSDTIGVIIWKALELLLESPDNIDYMHESWQDPSIQEAIHRYGPLMTQAVREHQSTSQTLDSCLPDLTIVLYMDQGISPECCPTCQKIKQANNLMCEFAWQEYLMSGFEEACAASLSSSSIFSI